MKRGNGRWLKKVRAIAEIFLICHRCDANKQHHKMLLQTSQHIPQIDETSKARHYSNLFKCYYPQNTVFDNFFREANTNTSNSSSVITD